MVFQEDCAVIDSIWNSLTILETFVVYFMSFFVCSSRIFYFLFIHCADSLNNLRTELLHSRSIQLQFKIKISLNQ